MSNADDGSTATIFTKSLLASALRQFVTNSSSNGCNGTTKMASNGHSNGNVHSHKSSNGFTLTNGTKNGSTTATTRSRTFEPKGANTTTSQRMDGEKVTSNNYVMKEATKRRDDYQRLATNRSKCDDDSVDHKDEDSLLDNGQNLCEIKDVPQYLRFNPFILSGYRAPDMSSKECVLSLCYFHNETVNILTHGKNNVRHCQLLSQIIY